MLLTALGVLFDAFQVIIAASDAVTDILVAKEFYDNPSMHTFFVLAVVILSITSVAAAILLCLEYGILKGDNPLTYIPVVMLAPLGLLLPTAHYFLEKCELRPNNSNGASAPVAADWSALESQMLEQQKREGSPTSTTGLLGRAAFKLFESKVASQQTVLGALDAALVARFRAFLLLNLEAVFESVPMTIIQLVAIAIQSGNVTTVQVISLSLSALSVSLKLWQLCRSFTVLSFLAKYVFALFDLFSSLFLFSVILSSSRSTNDYDVNLFGIMTRNTTVHNCSSLINHNISANNMTATAAAIAQEIARECQHSNYTATYSTTTSSELMVPGITYAWIIVKLICAVTGFLTVDVVGYLYMCSNENAKNIALFTIVGITGTVILGPILLLIQEISKLSWFTFMMFVSAPSEEDLPAIAMLHEFLHGAEASRPPVQRVIDWTQTLRVARQRAIERVKKYDKERQAASAARGFTVRQPYVSIFDMQPGITRTENISDDFNASCRAFRTNKARRPAKSRASNNNSSDSTPNFDNAVWHDSFAVRAHHAACFAVACNAHFLSKTHSGYWKIDQLMKDKDFYETVADLAVDGKWVPPPGKGEGKNADQDEGLDRLARHIDFDDDDSASANKRRLHENEPPTISHMIPNPFSVPGGWRCRLEDFFLINWIWTNVLSAVTSVAFCVVYLALYGLPSELMPRIMLYATIVFFALSLLLFPAFVTSWMTLLFYKRRLKPLACGKYWSFGAGQTPTFRLNALTIVNLIDAFTTLPLNSLTAIIGSESIPDVCVERHVLPFLTQSQVGLAGLFGDALTEVRKAYTEVLRVNAAAGVDADVEEDSAQAGRALEATGVAVPES